MVVIFRVVIYKRRSKYWKMLSLLLDKNLKCMWRSLVDNGIYAYWSGLRRHLEIKRRVGIIPGAGKYLSKKRR